MFSLLFSLNFKLDIIYSLFFWQKKERRRNHLLLPKSKVKNVFHNKIWMGLALNNLLRSSIINPCKFFSKSTCINERLTISYVFVFILYVFECIFSWVLTTIVTKKKIIFPFLWTRVKQRLSLAMREKRNDNV